MQRCMVRVTNNNSARIFGLDLNTCTGILKKMLVIENAVDSDNGKKTVDPGFKGGPSDLWTKTLQKYLKKHPFTPKDF